MKRTEVEIEVALVEANVTTAGSRHLAIIGAILLALLTLTNMDLYDQIKRTFFTNESMRSLQYPAVDISPAKCNQCFRAAHPPLLPCLRLST